jgi:exodeoxyribonuclease-5
MELTRKQEEGLRIALDKYRHNEKYVVISGYAGTGKSTLVRFIIDALQVDEEKVAYCAYTGKAAEVLRRKGNSNAMTLHKLLYTSIPKQSGGFYRKPKQSLDYSVIVVDEVSMVPKSMIDMLSRHKVFVIYLGDPEQLPMIDRNQNHDLLDHPDVFLDEVMRQAAESEIIQLTMKIRAGEEIPYIKGKEVAVIPKAKLVTGHLTWADIILTATNKTRIAINKQMREMLGFTGSTPNDGEKMICLSNYWEDLSLDGEAALVNGMTGVIHNTFENFYDAPRYVKMRDHHIPLITGDFTSDDGQEFKGVNMDKTLIETGQPFLDWKESYALGRLRQKIGDVTPRAFDYAYAITGHKSQGSQFSKVLVLEENFPFDRREHKRWLYTCCTRPEDKLVLVR